MFFIYPAAVSENCDRKIIAPACKCMERFFLTQLEDAFQSGIIRAKQKYDDSKKTYGQIMIESKKETIDASKLIKESSDPIQQLSNIAHDDYSSGDSRKIRDAIKKLDNIMCNTLNENIVYTANNMKKILEAHDSSDDDKDSKKKSSGAYTPLTSKIDIIPTSGSVKVPVMYVGGYGPDAGKEKEKTLVIGVKVMPFIMKNFKDVETALLDDYFSRVCDSAFKMLTRKIGRNLLNVYHNIMSRIPGMRYVMSAKVTSDQDDVKDTIYGASGFVNASAFRSNRNTPGNYKFTSNIIIFNKDDLTDPEDYNLFAHRSAMSRLFNMGWSTFAVLDPIKEEMTFISSLDGGYMHVIPYNYMFETIGTKTVYDSSSQLKNAARPFSVKRGNFSTFSKTFLD